MFQKPLKKMRPVRLITLGFFVLIAIGTALLMLPVASRSGVVTPLNEALLTATSATCVTGLVVHDTATYWSLFGQLVILALIQIGGLGFITIAISALSLTSHRIGLRSRLVMQEAIAGQQVGGIVKMGRFILASVLVVELIGAALLSVRFIPEFGPFKGIYYSIFHSISAFCNAGFDLMGVRAPYSSMTAYAFDAYTNIVLMVLIILGGLGFFVWNDIVQKKGRLRKFSLHSKLVLFTSAVLLLFGALFFFVVEWNNPAMGGNVWQRFLTAVFQSVTSRTAGFNTVNLADMSEASNAVMSFLMLIGGSPGSTAGGMKTTTLAILILSVVAEMRTKKNIECFHRRIDEHVLRQACCIAMLYAFSFLTGGLLLSIFEGIPLAQALFETASAVGTVGLTLGITPSLSIPSQLVITALMFIGRVGGFTFLLVFANRSTFTQSQLPLEKINVG